MSGFSRWKIVDPARNQTFQFRINPSQMGDPFPARNISATPNAMGTKMMVTEAPAGAVDWSFAGTMLAKHQFDTLYDWVYGKTPQRGLVVVTDHVGVEYVGYLTKLSALEERTSARYPYKRFVTVNMTLTRIPTKAMMSDSPSGAGWA